MESLWQEAPFLLDAPAHRANSTVVSVYEVRPDHGHQVDVFEDVRSPNCPNSTSMFQIISPPALPL